MRALKDSSSRGHQSAEDYEVDLLPSDVRQIPGITGIYVRLLKGVLYAPKLFVIIVFLLLIGGWGWYLNQGKGVYFFPTMEPTFIQVIARARGNLSSPQKRAITKRVSDVVYRMNDETKDFKAIATTSGEFPPFGTFLPGDTVGYIIATLNKWNQVRPSAAIAKDLNNRLHRLRGIHSQVVVPSLAPRESPTDIEVRVFGRTRGNINKVVQRIRNRLGQMRGVTNLADSRGIPGIEWNLSIDRPALAKSNVSVLEIGAALQMATIGLQLSSFRPVGSEMNKKTKIYALFEAPYRTLTGLRTLRIVTAAGNVPILNLLRITPAPRTNILYEYNGNPMGFVRADALAGYNSNLIVQQLKRWLARQRLPLGTTIDFAGESQDIVNSISFLLLAFFATIMLMSAILLIQFNDFFQMLLVLSAVVLSTTGIAYYMAFRGESFGVVMQGIAVVSLPGLSLTITLCL